MALLHAGKQKTGSLGLGVDGNAIGVNAKALAQRFGGATSHPGDIVLRSPDAGKLIQLAARLGTRTLLDMRYLLNLSVWVDGKAWQP